MWRSRECEDYVKVVEDAIVRNQGMRQTDPVWLHRMARAIIVAPNVLIVEICNLQSAL